MADLAEHKSLLSREEQLAKWLQMKNERKRDTLSTPFREVERNLGKPRAQESVKTSFLVDNQKFKPTKKSLLSSTIKKSQKESIPFKIPNELPKRKERVPYDPNAFKGDFESKLKYWTISEKCNRVLETESYRDGSTIFEDIEKRESIWLGDKAFFWVLWALFEEQFGHYVLAAALFEKAIKNKAKPLDLIQKSMSVILSRNERPSTMPMANEERKFSAYCEEIDDLLSDSEEEIEEQVTVDECRKVLRHFSSLGMPGFENLFQHFNEQNDMELILQSIQNS